MRAINKNFAQLIISFTNNKTGCVLEGSSRSGKTYSGVDFIIWLCSNYSNLSINCVRNTYTSFKTTLYDDFSKRLKTFDLHNPFENAKEVRSFKIFDNTIRFIGADEPSKFEGAGSDIWYFNELLDINEMMFNLAEQRCRKFWFADYNPKFSLHWVYDKILKRTDIDYLHSTFKDNPFISNIELKKILSYAPTPVNIAQGTADDYMWNVYGLGKRAAQTGLIFRHINWISEFPKELDNFQYGIDFGYTNDPTAIVKVARKENSLYVKGMFYTPTENSSILVPIAKQIIEKDKRVWCDSADPAMIDELLLNGVNAYSTDKFSGSIKWGIDFIKRHKLYIVKDDNFIKEAENYRFKEVGGIALNEPVDEFNHYWDALRYVCIQEYRNLTQ